MRAWVKTEEGEAGTQDKGWGLGMAQMRRGGGKGVVKKEDKEEKELLRKE